MKTRSKCKPILADLRNFCLSTQAIPHRDSIFVNTSTLVMWKYHVGVVTQLLHMVIAVILPRRNPPHISQNSLHRLPKFYCFHVKSTVMQSLRALNAWLSGHFWRNLTLKSCCKFKAPARLLYSSYCKMPKYIR